MLTNKCILRSISKGISKGKIVSDTLYRLGEDLNQITKKKYKVTNRSVHSSKFHKWQPNKLFRPNTPQNNLLTDSQSQSCVSTRPDTHLTYLLSSIIPDHQLQQGPHFASFSLLPTERLVADGGAVRLRP